MLYLKLMSDQDMPDSEPNKDFTILTVPDEASIDFVAPAVGSDDKFVRVIISYPDGRTIDRHLDGNAYVLNANGKTIASRASY